MALDTVEYRGYNIFVDQEVMLDDDFVNPRMNDNLGIMVCFHRRYILGDAHGFDTPQELLEFTQRDDVLALPLFLLDHSGVAMCTRGFNGCDPQGWDWGQVGYIYVTYEELKQEYGNINPNIIETAKHVLTAEVTEYSDFIAGNVYIIDIHDPEGELVESMHGIIGTDALDNAKEEAQAIVDNIIEKEAHELLPEDKYVKRKVCPNCKKPLKEIGVTLGGNTHYMDVGNYKKPYWKITQKVACGDCKHEWQEKYELELVGYETIDKE